MGVGEPERGVVLLVDASPGSAEAIADAGFDIERAPGAEAALDRVASGPVDCAVVGHAPPEVDGPALAGRLAERRSGLPVVLRPAEGSESLASEAVAAGVAAYVPSDEGPDRLVSAVERVVGGAGGRLAYREVFENVDAGLTVRDVETGELLDVNERYCDLLGYTREEAMALDLADVTADVPGYDVERAQELLDRAVEEPSFTFEWPDRRKDGELVWVEVDATVTTIEGRDRLLVTVRDVSDRRKRERALETLHGAAARLGECTTVEAACEATVRAASEVLDAEACAVLVEEGEGLVPKAVSADAPKGAVRRVRTDRELVEWTLQHDEPRIVDDAEDPTPDPADGSYRSGLAVPVGETAVLRAVATDPDAFGEADVELAELLVAHTARALDRVRFEAELRRRNERLEEFAGVVSHDLRNPLNVAQARLDLAREDESDADLDAVAGALSRMSAIVEDTLTLARQGRTAVEPEAVDLATFAGRCWRLVGTDSAELETDGTFTFQADPDRLHSLFENLFGNCVRHGSADGRSDAGTDADAGNAGPTVRVGAIDREGFFVEDDGPGIPAEKRGRVFEAGYTTSVDGTGFGLAIVEEIVEAHGWEVAVATSEAGGARFEVTGVESVD